MPTFLVTQSCGKERVINDIRAGEQNEWSEMLETMLAYALPWTTSRTLTTECQYCLDMRVATFGPHEARSKST